MESFESIKIDLLSNNIPCYVFWKDTYLTYQGGNELFLKAIGLSSNQEIGNRTDYDLPWSTEAECYQKSDRLVLAGKHIINSKELRWHANQGPRYIIVNKLPLKDEKDRIQGILCIHQDITWEHPNKSSGFHNNVLSQNTKQSEIGLLKLLKQTINVPLTRREMECLSLWVSGYSIKESSSYLNISEKSIEAYRANIKYKTKVHHKYQLIELMESNGVFHLFLALVRILKNKKIQGSSHMTK